MCSETLFVDGLPPDIMHDLLEGVVTFEMALVLKHLLKKTYFTLDELNSIISSWHYGQLDKENKPVEISTSFGDTIKQNAGRTWCLLRLFSLMVGVKVPTSDIYWQFFLQLKDIVELCFSLQLSLGHTVSLQQKIQDPISLLRELFSDRLLRPKQHFMFHYPRFFAYTARCVCVGA